MLVINPIPLEPARRAGDTKIQRGENPSPERRDIRVLPERNGRNADTTGCTYVFSMIALPR
jgi:hypothetical protein